LPAMTNDSGASSLASSPAANALAPSQPKLAAKLRLFDATMIVMGGVIGSGIFIAPSIVARQVHSPVLILSEWLLGGLLALLGALIYAELGARLPKVGGEYAYLREGLHPSLGFFYGWIALLVINAGGAGVVSLVFAKYLKQLLPLAISEPRIAAATIVILAAINCFGVRSGSNVQSALMLLRAGAAVMLVVAGLWFWRGSHSTTVAWHPLLDRPVSFNLAVAFGSGMIPVLFSYGGYQTANFVAAEMRDPRKDLPRALLLGTIGVIALYVGATFVCMVVLGPAGLAATTTPASEVMHRALGARGARIIALGITLSALGFLSQSILTYPRVFFAMAADGLFPAGISRVHSRSQVPVAAILLASLLPVAVVLVGHFEAIINYTESMDGLFFGLTASTLLVFRKRQRSTDPVPIIRVPGHPWTTLIFIVMNWLIVANSLYRYRANAVLVLGILLAGLPLYLYWSSKTRKIAP
jgi:basic amino acid/polyamine antiporter, APA family